MRRLLVLFLIASISLTACGSPASAPPLVPTQPSATAPAATLTEDSSATGAPNDTPTPAPSDIPAATLIPTIPPAAAIIGLDNFSQLVQLHSYAPDFQALNEQSAPGSTAPVYSPDSKTFIPFISFPSDSGKNELVIMDLATGKRVNSIPWDSPNGPTGLAFSPNGQYLLYSDYPDGKLVVWDLTAQKVSRTLFGKKHNVITDIAFTPDGKQVIAVTGDAALNGAGSTLMVWDFASGNTVAQLPADRQYGVDISKLSADGSRLTLSDQKGGKELSVYDTSTWKKIASIRPAGSAAEVAAISPNGTFVVTAKQSGGDILVWDAATGKQVSMLTSPFDDTADMEFNPDGSMLVVTGTPPFKPKTDNAYLSAGFWDTSTWQQVGVQHWVNTQDLKFAPDGKSLMLTTNSGLDLYLIGLPDQGFQAPGQAVLDFTAALGKGDYAAAASLLNLTAMQQDYYKSKGLINDPAAILEAICTRNAFPCLPAKVIYSARDADVYHFLVQFTNPDGTTYANKDGATLFPLYSEQAPDGSYKADLPDVPDDVLKK
jgi:WD40 repeat protein